MADDDPVFFEDGAAFRRWLRDNHKTAEHLWVGYHRVSTGRKSMTWSESVDEALCYGWIDGIRKRIDEESYRIRFTPRRPGSNWSKVNIEKVEKLIASKRMRKAGLVAWERRTTDGSGVYGYENEAIDLEAGMQKRLEADAVAAKFWASQPPGYKKNAQRWVMTAKKAETRERRFTTLLTCCRDGLRVPPLRR